MTQWAYNASGMMKSMTYPGDNQGNTGESCDAARQVVGSLGEWHSPKHRHRQHIPIAT